MNIAEIFQRNPEEMREGGKRVVMAGLYPWKHMKNFPENISMILC